MSIEKWPSDKRVFEENILIREEAKFFTELMYRSLHLGL